MNTLEKKKSLMLEMIQFANVDGKLHDREYQFLYIVAAELGFSDSEFDDLFHDELPILPIKSEHQRIEQFYRLALLMHIDGVLHEREELKINEIGLKMGLNPLSTKEILRQIKCTPGKIIDAELVLNTFKKHQN